MPKKEIKINQKKLLTVIILVAVSLSLALILIYCLAPQWLVNQLFILNGGVFRISTTSLSLIPTSWKTYINYDNGIELKYPKDWSFWEQSDDLTYHADFTDQKGGVIRIDFNCSYVIGGTEEERSMVEIDRQQFGKNVFVRHRLLNDFNQDGKKELVIHAYSTPYPKEYISSGRMGDCRLLTFIIKSHLKDETILPMILASLKFIGFEKSPSVFLWDNYKNNKFGFSMELPYEWKAYDPDKNVVLANRPLDFPSSEKIYTGPSRPVFFISLRDVSIPNYSERLPDLKELGYFYNVSDKDGVILSDDQTLLFLLELPNNKHISIRTFSENEPLLRQIVKTIIIPEFDIRGREI